MARSTDETGMASENLSAEEQAAMDADRAAEIEHPPEDVPAEPEPAEGAAPEGQDPPQRQGMVPHAALHEERTKRQETERQLAESRKAQQTLEERTNLILQRFAAPQQQQPQPQNQPQAPEIPAFDQDPAGHILANQRQQQAIIQELVQAVVGQGQQSEAARQAEALRMRTAAVEHQYAAANPGYDKAANYLFDTVRQELIISGVTDPAKLQDQIREQALILAATAERRGVNPGDLVQQYAKARGYREEPAAPVAPANGEDQLRTIDAGQQQSRSVGNMRGSGSSPLTAQRLAEMSDTDFLKMMDTKEGRDLMGA